MDAGLVFRNCLAMIMETSLSRVRRSNSVTLDEPCQSKVCGGRDGRSIELRDDPIGWDDDTHTQSLADRTVEARAIRRVGQRDPEYAHLRDDVPVARVAATQWVEQRVHVGLDGLRREDLALDGISAERPVLTNRRDASVS